MKNRVLGLAALAAALAAPLALARGSAKPQQIVDDKLFHDFVSGRNKKHSRTPRFIDADARHEKFKAQCHARRQQRKAQQ